MKEFKNPPFQNTLRVIVTMKNIEIISHILFELTLATCISKAKVGKVNPILLKNPPTWKSSKLMFQPCRLSDPRLHQIKSDLFHEKQKMICNKA